MLRNRRAALDGLSRILDAGAPEDLFVGPEDDALFLYDLLVDASRARSSSYYWEICRTARRRSVTPEYVSDRAAVLLAAMTERRRSDLYRILGVPPLASEEVIRQRWLEVAKRHHPDAGGDAGVFRHVKQAYEVLREPDRRAEYERFWLRALGPFERVVPSDEVEIVAARERPRIVPPAPERPAPPPAEAAPPPQAAQPPVQPTPAASPAPPPVREEPVERPAAVSAPAPGMEALRAAAGLLDRREALAQRLVVAARADTAADGLDAVLGRLETALVAVRREEIDALAAEVRDLIGDLDALRTTLAAVADVKRRF